MIVSLLPKIFHIKQLCSISSGINIPIKASPNNLLLLLLYACFYLYLLLSHQTKILPIIHALLVLERVSIAQHPVEHNPKCPYIYLSWYFHSSATTDQLWGNTWTSAHQCWCIVWVQYAWLLYYTPVCRYYKIILICVFLMLMLLLILLLLLFGFGFGVELLFIDVDCCIVDDVDIVVVGADIL